MFVEDLPRYGLNLHLGVEVEKLSLDPVAQPRYNPEYDEPLIREIHEVGIERGLVFVAEETLWPTLVGRIAGYGYRTRRLGDAYRGRVIFEVLPPDRPP